MGSDIRAGGMRRGISLELGLPNQLLDGLLQAVIVFSALWRARRVFPLAKCRSWFAPLIDFD